jgi:phosphoribosyl 1,2-cyclic phosphate phosphodiesterase
VTASSSIQGGQIEVTILGCGGSLGVPIIGNEWGRCNPDNPRNRRTRASIVIEGQGTRLLIDTSPDLRAQLLREDFGQFDAVLFTHHHADHTNGLDDLRPVTWHSKEPMELYAHAETLADLTRRFPYIFNVMQGDTGKLYKPFMQVREFTQHQRIGNLEVTAFEQDHHTCISMGFRIGSFAYSTDVAELDEAAFDLLQGIDTWIVDCTRREPHPSHAHMEKTLEWIERIKPRRAILTHMNHTMDYDAVNAETPEHVEPAYDGMRILCAADPQSASQSIR